MANESARHRQLHLNPFAPTPHPWSGVGWWKEELKRRWCRAFRDDQGKVTQAIPVMPGEEGRSFTSLTHPLTVPNSPHLPWAERCENVQTADPEDPSPWRKLSQAPTGSLSSGADPAAPGLRRLHRPRTDGAVGTTPADIRAESSSPSPRHPACPFPRGCVHNTCRRGSRRGVRGVNSPRWKDARRSSTACEG